MQIFALDKDRLIHAFSGTKKKNYICPECGGVVRLKGGKERISHFFHPKKNFLCRQSKKGPLHLRLQSFVHYLFEDEQAEMEKRFPEIGRIADVACVRSKRIYEIQCAPMTPEEAKDRCQDYESLGFEVIWILHEKTYNRRKPRPVEKFLQTKTCYYSNMDKLGNGILYDKLPIYGKRTINLRKCRPLPRFAWPEALRARGQNWPYYHEGDYFDLALRGYFPRPEKSQSLLRRLRAEYVHFLYILLEKNCK